MVGGAVRPDRAAVRCDEKFVPILRRVVVRLLIGPVYDVARAPVVRTVVYRLERDPALAVLRAVARPEKFADERPVRVADDIRLIVARQRVIMLRQPRQIELYPPRQLRQQRGGVFRHILHLLRRVLFARDAPDAERRVAADALRGIPAAV